MKKIKIVCTALLCLSIVVYAVFAWDTIWNTYRRIFEYNPWIVVAIVGGVILLSGSLAFIFRKRR